MNQLIVFIQVNAAYDAQTIGRNHKNDADAIVQCKPSGNKEKLRKTKNFH